MELQTSSFDWDNWPSLKTLSIADSSFPSPKMALEAMRDIDFKRCQSLEKVTFGVDFDVAELSRIMITTITKDTERKITAAITGEDTITETEKIFMKEIGTVLALAFNPKSDIDCFKLEHLDKLEMHMRCLDDNNSDNINRTLKNMEMIGEAVKNI